MHIKRLTIQGFKSCVLIFAYIQKEFAATKQYAVHCSYRDQTVVDPFSAGVNVVVGRNGSGKSNFFSAIRFVLSDAYTALSKDQRQSLLHEGVSTTATFSAYVEIVFDNTDGRFPTGKDEVILRRTVGAKKDEYALDRKSTNKGEVMSLLESAGFSRSNPYYIVPQGRITHLTNQKDTERLDLLKEVAGTKVYEDRRAESLKIIEETDAKREKIDELLGYIDERLNDLEEEKKELKEYTVRDRERRCLEYTIYQRNLEEASDALETLEDERRESINNSNAARESYEKRQREIANKENEHAEQQQRLDMLHLEKSQVVSDRKDATKSRTQIECIIRDLQEATDSAAAARFDLNRNLESVEAEIETKQAALSRLAPLHSEALAKEKGLKASIEDKTTRLNTLYDKQGRSTQFKTQRERDAYLNAEIDKLKLLIPTSETRIAETESSIRRTKERLVNVGERADALIQELDGRKSNLQGLVDQVQKLKGTQLEHMERRKQLWKDDTKLDATVRHAKDEIQNAERTLYSAMDKNTAAGLRAVDRIVRQHNIQGVHGPLYSLFTVNDAYRQAAEVAAGASLFHIVVESDQVATHVLEIMQRERAGRVTFVPLNRLNIKPVQYPESSEVQPLLRKLRFDPKLSKAFEQVFGKILVCNKLEEAGAAMRQYNLTVITMDGDRVDRKGALTGGFHDVKRSRLDSAVKLKRWADTYEQDNTAHQKIRTELASLDQTITRMLGEVNIAEKKLQNAQGGRAPVTTELSGLREEESQLQDRVQKLESALDRQKNDLKSFTTQKTAYESEMATQMQQTLSDAELATLDSLTRDVESHKQELAKVTRNCAKLAGEKSILEIELNETLMRRRDQLKSQIESMSEGGESEQPETAVASRTAELNHLTAHIATLQEKIAELDQQIENTNETLLQIVKDLEKLNVAQSEDAKGINKQQKGAERYHAKRQLLMQRKEECSDSIRDLGVLPEEAYDKYMALDSEKLVKNLHKTQEALKKFAHVNKKAVEQFSSFTTQKEQLETRRKELESSSQSIEDLVDVLDQRKDEAIERTFKQVSKYFAETFEKLVPAGRGRLIMQKRLGDGQEVEEENVDGDDAMDVDDEEEESEDLEEDEEEEQRPSKRKSKKQSRQKPVKKQKTKKGSAIDLYTGIAIQVSFNSKLDEGLRIQQLSGGQKSLVALTMVFAIQKCDPAPFYLFDEIDANLDADRRTAIAAMIKDLSADGQFIITTFRPELLAHADQFLGVIFDARKISTIKQITQEDCYSFVEANEKAA